MRQKTIAALLGTFATTAALGAEPMAIELPEVKPAAWQNIHYNLKNNDVQFVRGLVLDHRSRTLNAPETGANPTGLIAVYTHGDDYYIFGGSFSNGTLLATSHEHFDFAKVAELLDGYGIKTQADCKTTANPADSRLLPEEDFVLNLYSEFKEVSLHKDIAKTYKNFRNNLRGLFDEQSAPPLVAGAYNQYDVTSLAVTQNGSWIMGQNTVLTKPSKNKKTEQDIQMKSCLLMSGSESVDNFEDFLKYTKPVSQDRINGTIPLYKRL